MMNLNESKFIQREENLSYEAEGGSSNGVVPSPECPYLPGIVLPIIDPLHFGILGLFLTEMVVADQLVKSLLPYTFVSAHFLPLVLNIYIWL